MKLLLRKIIKVDDWNRSLESKAPEVSVLKELCDPTLSVFEIDREEDVPLLAAAMCFSNIGQCQRSTFASADADSLGSAGIKIKKTPGETKLSRFDVCHFEVLMENAQDVEIVIRQFQAGKPYFVPKPKVEEGLKQLFAIGAYDFSAIAKTTATAVPPIAKGLLSAIESKALSVLTPATV